MGVQAGPRRRTLTCRQRGQSMLLTVLLLAVGVGAVIYNFVTPARQSIQAGKVTAAALAQAKAALIGYAVGIRLDTGVSPRVGDLPCPDITNDGTAGGSCSNAGGTTLGRLPWKTLGLPDLRDGAGERLWYAVSANFKNNPAVGVLNSDARGTITVRDRSGAVLHDGTNPDPYSPSGVIAVIVAPGAILRRNDGTAQDRSAAGQNNPVNYLDLANVGNNEDNADFQDGTANGFINGDVLDASGNIIVNDRLITITYQDLMPLMERRVAKEALNCLAAYATANGGRYPWAADVASGAYSDVRNPPLRYGRIPDPPMSQTVLGVTLVTDPTIGAPLQAACHAQPDKCMQSQWPDPPACNFASGTWWQNWKEQVFYGVAPAYAPDILFSTSIVPFPFSVNITLISITPTGGCGSCLTVNPPSLSADKQVVVLVAGKQLAGVSGGQPRLGAGRLDQANYVEGDNDWAAVLPFQPDVFSRQPASTNFNDVVLFK